jgi:hypothetical protein
MTIKSIGLVLLVLLGTSFGATAAPLSQAGAVAVQAGAADPVRYYYRRHRAHFHRGNWWRPDFWGNYRYIGPYSNRTNTHMF